MTLIINNKEYDKALFIHIPKTAGTSISKELQKTNLLNWQNNRLNGHKSFMTVMDTENVLEDTFKFTVVRDPFTRAYSYFKHFNKVNNTNFLFNDFLDAVTGTVFYEQNPFIKFDQSHYIYSKDQTNTLDKIYKFENLIELEKDFGFKLPFERKGNYTLEEYNKDYTYKTINRVLYIYEKDFINLGYSQEFKYLTI